MTPERTSGKASQFAVALPADTGRTASPTTRLYHLDVLRCLSMLGVVVLHAVFSFAVSAPDWWSTRAADRSYAFDAIIFAIMGITMKSFFLLSGYFTARQLRKQSLLSFAANRYRRIVLPFVFSVVLIVPLTRIVLLFGAVRPDASNPVQRSVRAALSDAFSAKFFTYFSFGHLWFLWYLLMLYAVVIVLKPLATQYVNLAPLDRRVATILQSPFKPVLLAVPTACLGFLMTWMMDTPFGLLPEWHILAYYGFFFSFGMLLSRQAFFGESVKHWRLYLLLALFAVLPGTLALILKGAASTYDKASPYFFATRAFYALYTWLMIFGLLGFFQRRPLKPGRFLQYVTGASFWVYIVHLPVVLVFQLLVRDLRLPLLLKFFIVLLATVFVVGGSYHAFVRNKFIGRFLNGGTMKRKTVAEERVPVETAVSRTKEQAPARIAGIRTTNRKTL